MVIYEVNLTLNAEIFNAFYAWLPEHMQQILQHPGFLSAEMGVIEQQDESHKKQIRVSYTIDHYDHLQDYLTHHAPNMRADAIKQFGDQFSATRRVILDSVVLDAGKH